jgi:hypothetical protein
MLPHRPAARPLRDHFLFHTPVGDAVQNQNLDVAATKCQRADRIAGRAQQAEYPEQTKGTCMLRIVRYALVPVRVLPVVLIEKQPQLGFPIYLLVSLPIFVRRKTPFRLLWESVGVWAQRASVDTPSPRREGGKIRRALSPRSRATG